MPTKCPETRNSGKRNCGEDRGRGSHDSVKGKKTRARSSLSDGESDEPPTRARDNKIVDEEQEEEEEEKAAEGNEESEEEGEEEEEGEAAPAHSCDKCKRFRKNATDLKDKLIEAVELISEMEAEWGGPEAGRRKHEETAKASSTQMRSIQNDWPLKGVASVTWAGQQIARYKTRTGQKEGVTVGILKEKLIGKWPESAQAHPEVKDILMELEHRERLKEHQKKNILDRLAKVVEDVSKLHARES